MNSSEIQTVSTALSGALLVGYWTIGLFFFRFKRRSGDRFFAFFGWAFWLLACERVLLLATSGTDEGRVYIYLIRLTAFLFILYAIFDKNRVTSASSARPVKRSIGAEPVPDRNPRA